MTAPDPRRRSGQPHEIHARDIRTLLWLDRPIAKVIVLLFCVTSSMRATAYLADAHDAWPVLVALALTTAGALAIVGVSGDPLPLLVAVALTALGPVAALLVLPQVDVPGWIMSDIWFARPIVAILCFMSLRGRIFHACAGALLTMATFTVWTGLTDQGWGVGLRLSAIVFAPVLISVLVAVTVRPVAFAVFTLREREAERAADEAMTAAVVRERDQQLAALDVLARPLLESSAAGAVFTDRDREECALVEERLRDTLRAPVFADDEPLCRATAAARRRGTAVILLDDGGLTDPALAQRVRAALIGELDSSSGGTVTARALPAGRAWSATIVVESGSRVRRVEFDATGTVRTEVRDDGDLDADHQALRTIAEG
ncbi:hypothetical protein ACFYVR_08985 [Rhodococcus sp. NPDC003318]|uniref:hypothetical protein n=1 Tax=Rhodococcus sp. NPDC003318 TaxID=3364503 RepID=UPI003689FFE7